MSEKKTDKPGSGVHGRRSFIKHVVLGSAFSMLANRAWLAMLVADCEPTTPGGGILRVRIGDFPALQAENGSVRLLLNPINSLTHLPNGAFYPVLINRGANSQFFGLSTRCMHQNCVVPPFDVAQGASVCPCHASRYRIDGTVIPGSLSLGNLQRYTTNFDGVDLLCIEVPGLGYSVTGTAVDTVGPRFRLQFPTKSNVIYEVRFRQSVGDVGTVVPFSTTDTGTATMTALTGNNANATVYVDRTADAGFYSVAVQVTAG